MADSSIRNLAAALLACVVMYSPFALAESDEADDENHPLTLPVDGVNLSDMSIVIGDVSFRLSSTTKVYLPGSKRVGTIFNLKVGQMVQLPADVDQQEPLEAIQILGHSADK